jgi:hypothetical protein
MSPSFNICLGQRGSLTKKCSYFGAFKGLFRLLCWGVPNYVPKTSVMGQSNGSLWEKIKTVTNHKQFDFAYYSKPRILFFSTCSANKVVLVLWLAIIIQFRN